MSETKKVLMASFQIDKRDLERDNTFSMSENVAHIPN